MDMEMAMAVAGGIVVGYVLDQYFNTEPVLTIIFMCLGCVGGGLTFVRLLKFFKKSYYGAGQNGLGDSSSETEED